jgi:hypothetical protein
VLKQHDEVRKFNYIGDTQLITGEITDKREENGRYLVDVVLRCVNQREEETVRATATIALPSRKAAIVLYPEVPADLAAKAAQMMARHWELSAQAKKG